MSKKTHDVAHSQHEEIFRVSELLLKNISLLFSVSTKEEIMTFIRNMGVCGKINKQFESSYDFDSRCLFEVLPEIRGIQTFAHSYI